MDIAPRTFGVGLNLTNTKLEGEFAAITSHQINRVDFATNFSWGIDIDLDGFGLSGLRHINGNVAFARHFLTGNGSAAIQAAIDFVNASSPGSGVVYVTPISDSPIVGHETDWNMTGTVTVPSGISIVGLGYPVLRKNAASVMFQLGAAGAGADDVTFEGLAIEGNDTAAGFCTGGDSNRITIRDCIFGVGGTNGVRHMRGAVLTLNDTVSGSTEVQIYDNFLVEQIELCDIETVTSVRVCDNFVKAPDNTAYVGGDVIRLLGCTDFIVSGNYIDAKPGNTGGGQGAASSISIEPNGGGTGSLRGWIVGNFARGGHDHICAVNDTEGLFIEGNTFFNAGQGGALNSFDAINLTATVAGNTKHVMVRNNIASNAPDTVSETVGQQFTRYGIRLEANVQHSTIVNNFVENIDDAPATSTHWYCGTAGISVAAATGIVRYGNQIIEDQWVQGAKVGGGTSLAEPFTCNGIRHDNAAGAGSRDQPRHDQVVTVLVGYSSLVTGIGSAGWFDQTTVNGTSKFAEHDEVICVRGSGTWAAEECVIHVVA